MDFVYISQVLSKTIKAKEHHIFLAKVGEFYLIGPLVSKNFCVLCFRKRLLSSSIRRIEDYKSPLQKDRGKLKKLLTEKAVNLSMDTMIEIDLSKQKIIKRHSILPIPGCKACEKTYE